MAISTKKLFLVVISFYLLPLLSARIGELGSELQTKEQPSVSAKESLREVILRNSQEHRALGILTKLKVKAKVKYYGKKIKKLLTSKSSKKGLFKKKKSGSKGKGGKGGKGKGHRRELQASRRSRENRNDSVRWSNRGRRHRNNRR